MQYALQMVHRRDLRRLDYSRGALRQRSMRGRSPRSGCPGLETRFVLIKEDGER
jgi:hypothetical protein